MKIESPATLPLTLSEVTADTVSILLRRQFPGTDVTALQIGDVIPGTCTKARLHLDYNAAGRAHGLPPTMCMKGGFESHGLTGQLYPREVWFYRHLADGLTKSEVPASSAAACSQNWARKSSCSASSTFKPAAAACPP
jgi:hypothetical protein